MPTRRPRTSETVSAGVSNCRVRRRQTGSSASGLGAGPATSSARSGGITINPTAPSTTANNATGVTVGRRPNNATENARSWRHSGSQSIDAVANASSGHEPPDPSGGRRGHCHGHRRNQQRNRPEIGRRRNQHVRGRSGDQPRRKCGHPDRRWVARRLEHLRQPCANHEQQMDDHDRGEDEQRPQPLGMRVPRMQHLSRDAQQPRRTNHHRHRGDEANDGPDDRCEESTPAIGAPGPEDDVHPGDESCQQGRDPRDAERRGLTMSPWCG